jgi:hypothetical protein
MPNQIATARMEETREHGRLLKRRTDEDEDDLEIMEIRNWHRVVGDRKE